RLRMRNDTLVIDTLAARAGSGFLAVGGSVDLHKVAEPGFALQVAAVNALMLDNQYGRINADATLGVNGPFEAVTVDGVANVRNGVIYIPESSHKQVINTGDPSIFAVV